MFAASVTVCGWHHPDGRNAAPRRRQADLRWPFAPAWEHRRGRANGTVDHRRQASCTAARPSPPTLPTV